MANHSLENKEFPHRHILKRNFTLKFEHNKDPVLFDVTLNGKKEGLLFYEAQGCDLYLYNKREIHPNIILDSKECYDDYEFEFIIYLNKTFIYGNGVVYENDLYLNKKRTTFKATNYLYMSSYDSWELLMEDLPLHLRRQLYINKN